MGDLVPLLGLGVLLLLVLGVAAFWGRRVLLTRGIGAFECSMRRASLHRTTGGWMLGVARYERDRLDWFRVVAVSPWPTRSLDRERLVILARVTPDAAEGRVLLAGWVVVRCGYGGDLTVELAMSDAAADGLAAWLESAPPGPPVSVT